MVPVDFSAHIHPNASFPEFDDIIGSMQRDPSVLEELYASVDAEAVLSQPAFMGHESEDETATANDGLVEMVETYDRFYGLAAIPTAAGGKVAAAEFERALDNGLHGGAIETRSAGIELIDDQVEPILQVADQREAPLLVHPKPFDSLHPEALDESYQLNSIFGREIALAESMCKVVHDDLLDSYPDLRLVFHHLGGNIASMLGRVHLRLDAGRWPRQEKVKDFPEFKEGLEQLYVDTAGFFGYQTPLRNTLEAFPSSQVLFGTDIPYEARNETELASFINTITDTTSTTDANKVLGENARELLANVS